MPSSRLDVALRFELATEEGRALFVSYGVASALALAWLLVVQVMPVRADEPAVRPDEPIIVVPPPEDFPTPREVGGHSSAPSTRRASRGGAPGARSIRDAFGGTAGLVDAGRILRGVDLSRGSSAAGEAGVRKVGLGTGIASRTPGLSREGGVSPTGAGVGTVAGEGVSRGALTIAPPEVRPIAHAPSAGAATEVGQSARAHVPQLERCYYAEGLSRNPALAGLVRLAITVEGGRVTTAEVVSRSWAGAGASETERCLVRVARGWRLGSSSAHIVLPLSFTSPTR
ncbi:MAG TPA: hypothetical protein VFB46_17385 [Gemmatimonadaceae bacterium]|nr:hypothetical protein [Gemmatimonadaceae bacterium]